MDAFQGCYKDGTNGTRDCRYFAGLQLVLHLLFPFIFLIARETMLSLYSYAVVLGLYITIFVTVQPYKVTVYNKADVPLFLALLMTVFSIGYSVYPNYSWLKGAITILCVCAPLLYLVIWSALQVKHIITRTWC